MFPSHIHLSYTSGFWPRVCARALRAPVFLGSLPSPTGRCAPPTHCSFAASPKIKNKLFPETKCFPSGPNSGRQEIYFSNGQAAPYWATLHLTELRYTHVSYAAPYWATLHPTKLCCIQVSYAAPYLSFTDPKSSATPSELRRTLLSYDVTFWAKLHPTLATKIGMCSCGDKLHGAPGWDSGSFSYPSSQPSLFCESYDDIFFWCKLLYAMFVRYK
jgi:hypothetical protein